MAAGRRFPCRRLTPSLFLLGIVALATSFGYAQITPVPPSTSAQPTPEAEANTYHLRTSSRIVLTDVTVTDKTGRRITGLRASDFVLTDDKQPQKLASFAEHTPELSGPITEHLASRPAAFSNAYTLHPPPVLNVLLIDITNVDIEDQLYLNYQLTRLLEHLPAGEPIAVYWCRGPNVVLLQNFTADHAALLTALHKALPRFPPTGREYYSSAGVLQGIAVSLAGLPGRKNVLWFSGGDFTSFSPFGDSATISAAEEEALHVVYDELEAGRIAIYPFDARGLVTGDSLALTEQHQLLREVAENTGGQAIVNNNGLELEASRLIAEDGAYYTLTYAPRNFQPDGRWHTVQVSLAPPYQGLHLSYRRGYFADATGSPPTAARAGATASAARTSGSLPDTQRPAIIFDVEPVLLDPGASGFTPAALTLPLTTGQHRHGTRLYVLRYHLPLADFAVQAAATKPSLALGVAALAFNSFGSIAARRAEKVSVNLNPAALPVHTGDTLTIDQQVALPKGDTTVFCAVWDMATKRVGTVQFPLEIPR